MMSLNKTYWKALLCASVLLGTVAGLWLSARAISECGSGAATNGLHPCILEGEQKCTAVGKVCVNDTGRWYDNEMVGFNCCIYDSLYCCQMTLSKRICKVSQTQECWVRYPRWFKDHGIAECWGGRLNDNQCASGQGTP